MLPDPFLVVATQNPIEYEGTYPLPEAQLDRFLFKLLVAYPSFEQEEEILARHDGGLDPHDLAAAGLRAVAGPATSPRPGPRSARFGSTGGSRRTSSPWSGPRGTPPRSPSACPPAGATMLLRSAKAWSWLAGRQFVTPDEVKAMAKPTLRHRIQLRPEAELEGVTPDAVLDGLLTAVPVPR